MDLFQSFILGMIQGVTEFVPVSSSAHLILFPWLMKWEDPGLAFDVFLHLGTLVALFIYFFRELWGVAMGGIQSVIERRVGFEPDRMLFWWIVIGTIPGAVAGLLFNHYAETVFRNPLLIAMTLSLVGFVIFWVDSQYPALRKLEDLSLFDVLWIGLAQAFAIIPGFSRSGSTMGMGRLLGFSRDAAARFSFLLCTPIILGAVVTKIKPLVEQIGNGMDWQLLAVGFGSSFFFGIISIHFMLRYLRSSSLAVFTWYRVALAIFVVFWSLFH